MLSNRTQSIHCTGFLLTSAERKLSRLIQQSMVAGNRNYIIWNRGNTRTVKIEDKINVYVSTKMWTFVNLVSILRVCLATQRRHVQLQKIATRCDRWLVTHPLGLFTKTLSRPKYYDISYSLNAHNVENIQSISHGIIWNNTLNSQRRLHWLTFEVAASKAGDVSLSTLKSS